LDFLSEHLNARFFSFVNKFEKKRSGIFICPYFCHSSFNIPMAIYGERGMAVKMLRLLEELA
jgi:hypothetical protein